ncbi:shikimate dehydrogenase [Nocardioides sp. KR10-350]|uniref:shikimate dehydrogenase n=1 Tax=Nocardioides cheoyonin TaxID=3156615 RepID=UPI0032B43FD2
MDQRPYLVGLIGAGVTPSLTPALHMREAGAHGIPYVYRTIDLTTLRIDPIRVGELVDVARTLGYDALNITHPCKQLVIGHLSRLDRTAARLGAVNTVVFDGEVAVGHNTDTTGFASAMRAGLPAADLGEVVQLGAGGAGTAVADALLGLGAERLVVVDLDEPRAQELARDLGVRHTRASVEAAHPDKLPVLLAEATGLVNCTPVGMADHPGLPIDADLLHPRHWVADIVYRPLETPLLAAARSRGCRTLHGGHMAVYQAVDAFRLITGVDPDARRMLAHLRELVASDN